ncbi:MAG: alkaline shock response membrane anchor protein AmaP [Veillonellaceae bacterium]|jgi:uncharacterized alkaline shock family protein YloU|nr:alkaline shock response membrane anchor protein AmaP [Veillonellaceae bacterium]
MGIFDRIILSIYTLLLTFLSVGVMLIALRLISLDLVWTSLNRIYGQWEAALIGAVFLLVSIRLMLAGLRTKHNKGTIVHHNDFGDVHITLDAVENLIEKTARHVRGVRSVKINIERRSSNLFVTIRAIISPESNVPDVSKDIQQRVHDHIKSTVGIELADVRILVENISNDFKPKQRVE